MIGLDPLTVRWIVPLLMLGHLALWVGIFNRLHALNVPHEHVRWLERYLVFPLAAFLPLLLLPLTWYAEQLARPAAALLAAYHGLALAALLLAIAGWCWREWRRAADEHPLLANHTIAHDWRAQQETMVAAGMMQRMAALPGNEILQLHVHHKRLEVPRLPAALAGLTIAHLSDFHFTGRFSIEFYQAIIAESNDWNPDVVMITGDVVDKAHCLPWIPETLGRLESKYGAYFVLGNHDLRVHDEERLRRLLAESGIMDVGSRWELPKFNDVTCLVAGDERPWFGPGPALEAAPDAALRILLAHSPDRFRWAVGKSFDLVLAGHTHGGQIRFPWIGPVVCPSAYGVRYASGVFSRDTTVMHVTRGLCGVHPLRFGCPPELSILTLQLPSTEAASAQSSSAAT